MMAGASRLGGMLALAVLSASVPAAAEDWTETKCRLYRDAWAGAVERQGTGGLGEGFLASHDAFLAAGCTGGGRVCPRSDEEIALANILTVLAMNEGMASTFVPFGCGR